jgi:Ca2+-dependent lipid-binding protein
VSRAAFSLLKNQLEPLINDEMPDNVSKVSFYTLNLGSMPPVIGGVKQVKNQYGEFGTSVTLHPPRLSPAPSSLSSWQHDANSDTH